METDLIFEILAIDVGEKSQVKTEQNLCYSLLSNSALFTAAELNGTQVQGEHVRTSVTAVAAVPSAETQLNSAFQLTSTAKLEHLEGFRKTIAEHLRKQNFEKLYILRDDVSEQLANSIYPMINRLENRLRSYVIKFMTTRLGPQWWEVTASSELKKKSNKRKNNETVFFPLVDHHAYAIDFNDLGALIYSHISGANSKEQILSDIRNVDETPEAIRELKNKLMGNYQRFFEEHFRSKGFQKKWEDLNKTRRKVAHNGLFVSADRDQAAEMFNDLNEIIDSAMSELDDLTLLDNETTQIKESLVEHGMFDVVSPETLTYELAQAERYFDGGFVGLKHFVTNHLGNQGYDFQSSYSLINAMAEKGQIEIYHVDHPHDPGITTAAVRQLRPKTAGRE